MQRIFKGTKLNETHFSSRRILEDYSVDPLFPTTTLVWVLESNGWVRIAEMAAGGVAVRAMDRGRGQDQGSAGTQSEDRSAGCAASTQAIDRRSLSAHLGSEYGEPR